MKNNKKQNKNAIFINKTGKVLILLVKTSAIKIKTLLLILSYL